MKILVQLKRDGISYCTMNSTETSSVLVCLRKLFILNLALMVNIGLIKALPSYARQTGMSCTACHTSFPELTSLGRQFKLNGYTMTGMQTIESKEDSDRVTRLKLLSTLPLSAMFQSSFTNIAKDVISTQNNSVSFPQQFSLFFAGQVTPHIGTFIQMTYDGHTFGMDNADIRFSNQASIGTRNLIYGLTLNNNPSVQDVWNTLPAWRFPSSSSDAAPTPAKSTIMENLSTQVAGLGAYTLFNNLLFAELTVYRSAQQGAPNPADSSSTMTIDGIAPYWRLALQHQWADNYFELGTFGIASKHFLHGISGNMNKFTDVGFDFQYERRLTFGSFALHSSLINETETIDTSTTQHINLNFHSFKVDGSLYLNKGLGATIGYFATTGSEDASVGSVTNKPNSNGIILQLEYLPWYNTKFTIQYVMYNKFDGGTGNYDGFGRKAANNNTLYILAWLNF
ncbi:MAG: hypothetical protein NTW49_00710 [Bacteroidia bacterium]|nr:hypothetical protein [Bacteroidia bacterium]